MPAAAFEPPATLNTARLRLRPLDERDEALYVGLFTSEPTLRQALPAQDTATARRGFHTACRRNREQPARRRFWVLQPRDGDAAFGLIGLDLDEAGSGEVGVLMPPPRQGRGYATEAIAALADHAFDELGLARLHCRHAAEHALAAQLMATLGFERFAAAEGPRGWRWQLTSARWAGRPLRPATRPLGFR